MTAIFDDFLLFTQSIKTKDSILAKDQSDRKTQEIGEIIRESYIFNKRDSEFFWWRDRKRIKHTVVKERNLQVNNKAKKRKFI